MKKILLFSFCFCSLISFSQSIALQSFATGFSAPTEITHPPGDSRLFVVQQGGLIRIVSAAGIVNATPFLDLSTIISNGSERGLLGLAFHPNYATNGLFYVNYTNTAGNTVIARYGVSANPAIANTTGTILMTINQPASNHNGGTVKFGADGYLYIGMGDGGGAGDTSGYAQNLDLAYTPVVGNPTRIYLGKMLRIDVNTIAGSLNYGFPPTNPYVTQAGKEEIWTIGMRNPFKFSFNRLNGDLWIGDVGQGAVEEIDKVASPLPNTGLNFGWRCFEGSATYSSSIGTCPSYASTVAPNAQYTHTGSRCSIIGGYFYTGTAYPNFQNKYFFGDYCTGEIGFVNSTGAITWGYDAAGVITTFGEDTNGELYVANGSVLYKIVDTLGTTAFETSGFSLYPNPAKGLFFIKSTNEVMASKIELFDLTGKLLLSKNADGSVENSISVSNLAKGIYLVTVETSMGKKYTSKLAVE